jgi:predicted aspartyl protease
MRYAYNRQVTPPPPFVHVTVACPQTRRDWADLPAQMDTACDRTVVPLHVVERLGLLPVAELPALVAGGREVQMSIFLVRIALRSMAPITAEVFAHVEEPFILLGRDILNRYRIVLDGPNLSLEIS